MHRHRAQDLRGTRGDLFARSPVRAEENSGRETLHDAPIIYVHAKVSIFDDTRAIVSSANLNGRSLDWDTEGGVAIERRSDVEALRRRMFDHWLPDGADAGFHDLREAAGRWRTLAEENAAREPEQRQGFMVPYRLTPERRFGRPLPFVPDAMV